MEDEYHFLLCCPFYAGEREWYIPHHYRSDVTFHKFTELMASNNSEIIYGLSRFIFVAMKKRKDLLL